RDGPGETADRAADLSRVATDLVGGDRARDFAGGVQRPHLKNPGRSEPVKRRRGFTLLEIMIALAITGMLMVALNTFIFSMGELWGRNSDLRLFDRHVRAVTRFVERELRSAALPPAAVEGQAPITVQE